jgi:cysteine desulfurase
MAVHVGSCGCGLPENQRFLGPMKIPIYMDYHATTPVDPRVLEAMLPFFREEFGNAASKSHAFGWRAEEAVEAAREEVAKLVGASAKEIAWTSGATESDNLAIKGAAHFYQSKGKHLVTCKTEHKAVLDSMHALERQGFEVTFLDVEKDGRLDPAKLQAALRPDTILVSVMHANNETGVVHPIAEIGKITRAAGVLLHCDAVQSVGKIPFDVEAMNVDLASLSAHKMYGPKGVGALYVRRKPRVRLVAEMDGGGHERGFRSGTLNVPGIVGFGAAARLAVEEREAEAARVLALREKLRKDIDARLDLVTLNGSLEHRLPGNLNVSFAYVEGEALMMAVKDVAVSSGSACTSASLEPSYVLRAMGVSEDLAHSSIRFGLGRFTTEEEVEYVVRLVVEKVKKLREMSPLYEMVKDGVDLSQIEWANPH